MRLPPRPPRLRPLWPGRASATLLAALALLAACRAVARAPRPAPDVASASDLFEVVEEGDGRCTHAGDPDCLTDALHTRVRALRLRPAVLPGGGGPGAGGGREVRLNPAAGVSIPLWVQPPETLPLGFRRWRAQVLDDPDAWVGIVGSPLAAAPAAPAAAPAAPLTYAPPPSPLAAAPVGERARTFHDVAAWDEGAPAPSPEPKPSGGAGAPASPEPSEFDPGAPLAPTTPVPGDAISIWIKSPVHGQFEIHQGRDGSTYYAVRMDYSALPPCQLGGEEARAAHRAQPGCRCRCRCGPHAATPPAPPGSGDTSSTAAGTGVTWVGTPPVAQPVTVNVMMLYVAPAIPSWMSEADFRNNLMLSLAAANDALAVGATQVTLTCTCMGITPDAQGGAGTCSGVCAALSASAAVATANARFPWVGAWRDQWNVRADLVSLLLPGSPSDPYVGWADLLPGTQGDPTKAFSVVRTSGLGGLTLPHELAHNFGCCHGWRDADPSCPASGPDYRHGRRFPDLQVGPWTTLLGYSTGGLERVPGFSSPDARYQGSVMGHPTWSDNARMIRETAAEVAKYR